MPCNRRLLSMRLLSVRGHVDNLPSWRDAGAPARRTQSRGFKGTRRSLRRQTSNTIQQRTCGGVSRAAAREFFNQTLNIEEVNHESGRGSAILADAL